MNKKLLLLPLLILVTQGVIYSAEEKSWFESLLELFEKMNPQQQEVKSEEQTQETISQAKNNLQDMLNKLTPEQQQTLSNNGSALINSLSALATGTLGLSNLPEPLNKIYTVVQETYKKIMAHVTPERLAQAKQFISDITAMIKQKSAAAAVSVPQVIKPEEKPVPLTSPAVTTVTPAPTAKPVTSTTIPVTTTSTPKPLPASTVLTK